MVQDTHSQLHSHGARDGGQPGAGHLPIVAHTRHRCSSTRANKGNDTLSLATQRPVHCGYTAHGHVTYRALLVQGAITGGVRGRHDVIAEVASQVGAWACQAVNVNVNELRLGYTQTHEKHQQAGQAGRKSGKRAVRHTSSRGASWGVRRVGGGGTTPPTVAAAVMPRDTVPHHHKSVEPQSYIHHQLVHGVTKD
jgi:hypothetical protein